MTAPKLIGNKKYWTYHSYYTKAIEKAKKVQVPT